MTAKRLRKMSREAGRLAGLAIAPSFSNEADDIREQVTGETDAPDVAQMKQAVERLSKVAEASGVYHPVLDRLQQARRAGIL